LCQFSSLIRNLGVRVLRSSDRAEDKRSCRPDFTAFRFTEMNLLETFGVESFKHSDIDVLFGDPPSQCSILDIYLLGNDQLNSTPQNQAARSAISNGAKWYRRLNSPSLLATDFRIGIERWDEREAWDWRRRRSERIMR
jgi:hypothetical protein